MSSTRTSATLAATALVATLTTAAPAVTAAAAPSPPCTPSWQLVDIPQLAGTYKWRVDELDVLNSRDVRFGAKLGSTTDLQLRWDGRTLRQQPAIPLAPHMPAGMGDLSFHSATEGWTMVTGILSGQNINATARFSDGRWTLVPGAAPANPRTTAHLIMDIVSLSGTDAWAVGGAQQRGGGAAPLIQHWDGARWQVVDQPASALTGGALVAVSARSPRDVWATGTHRDPDDGSYTALFLHYDGESWQRVPAPRYAEEIRINALSARAADDVWAVGSLGSPAARASRPFALHWDGAQWHESTGIPDVGWAEFRGVYAAAPDSVWAVADFQNNDTVNEPAVFLHFDGTGWRTVPVPGPKTLGLHAFYLNIDGTGPDDVWAAGQTVDFADGRHTVPVIAHLSCGRRS